MTKSSTVKLMKQEQSALMSLKLIATTHQACPGGQGETTA